MAPSLSLHTPLECVSELLKLRFSRLIVREFLTMSCDLAHVHVGLLSASLSDCLLGFESHPLWLFGKRVDVRGHEDADGEQQNCEAGAGLSAPASALQLISSMA